MYENSEYIDLRYALVINIICMAVSCSLRTALHGTALQVMANLTEYIKCTDFRILPLITGSDGRIAQ